MKVGPVIQHIHNVNCCYPMHMTKQQPEINQKLLWISTRIQKCIFRCFTHCRSVKKKILDSNALMYRIKRKSARLETAATIAPLLSFPPIPHLSSFYFPSTVHFEINKLHRWLSMTADSQEKHAMDPGPQSSYIVNARVNEL